jgi:hypothetical protein
MAAMTKDEKLKAKREKLKVLGTGFGSFEPVIDKDNYTMSMMSALNYYNANFDNKEKRKWVYAYVGKQNSAAFDSVSSDFEFRSLGTVIRMKLREQYLEQRELDFIDSEIERLRNVANMVSAFVVTPKAKTVDTKPVVSIQDRIKEAASTHIGEFNGMFDDYIQHDIEPDFAGYLKANAVSPQVSKLIPPAFVSFWNELQELITGTDKQLVEGYSFLKKTKVKKLCKFIEDLENACAQQVVAAKSARKPRAKKEKPPSVVARSVKFMKEFTELGLTSVKPEKIIGASEVLVYNTKYKKVQIYRAINGGTLGIKGTTVIGYEVASSGAKTLRKPEQVKDFAAMTKRTFATAFKGLTTKEAAVNGRINEECIIVKVF